MSVTSSSFKEVIKKLSLENIFRRFGESENGPTIIACSIAIFKGIFRPAFTMMDKKQDPEAKKYAAVREGLTEVAAFPLYLITPVIASKLVDKFSKETDQIIKKRMKMNAKFFGICAATLIIPAVCNLIQPPIMAAYKRHQNAKKELDIKQNVQPYAVNKPSVQIDSYMQKTSLKNNTGMRVGN